MPESIDIPPADLEKAKEILSKHVPEYEVRAFGSRVAWMAKEFSDLDIAIMTDKPLDISRMADLREAFTESDLPIKVDLIDWAAIGEGFRKIIEKKYVVVQAKASSKKDEWRSSTWGEEISLEYGKALRNYKNTNGKYRVFGSNGPVGWTDKPLAQGPGIILGRKGAYRGVQYSSDPFFVIDTAYYVAPKKEFDMRWLYYAIKHYKLGEIDDGSPIPSTTRAAVYMMDLKVPSVSQQHATAQILGALDDKIELNRKTNETLEAMARALFKSWFIDFDPVRAKSEDRDTGLPKEIADLFPSEFENSELGEFPKGWEVKNLGDLMELAYGKALKAENRIKGNVPVYGSNGQVGWHDKKLVSGPGIIVGRKGNPGIVTWAFTDFYAIDTAFYVAPKACCQSLHFLYYVLQTHELASLDADSAVPGLNRNLAYMDKQVLPSWQLLDEFDSRIKLITKLIYSHNQESNSLISQREILLPKLITGKLSVVTMENNI